MGVFPGSAGFIPPLNTLLGGHGVRFCGLNDRRELPTANGRQ